MPKINDSTKAFISKLQCLYDIELQIEKALPKMAKAASSKDMKASFTLHHKETKEQVKRLERAFKSLEMKPKKTKVEGIRGIIADGEWVMDVDAPEDIKDAMLASAARYVEHYEMAGYTSAILEAKLLGLTDIEALLLETLAEEEQTDKILKESMKMHMQMA